MYYTFEDCNDLSDWISTAIPNRLYFGPYPNQCMADRLMLQKFDLLVNLTQDNEPGTSVYDIDNKKYMTFPITDSSFPQDPIEYSQFILTLFDAFKEGKKIYVHCRGGHQRSVMVASSLLCLMGNDLKTSLDITIQAHHERKIIRDKWKVHRSPLSYVQYGFLEKIHRNLYINIHGNKYYQWLSLADFKKFFYYLRDEEDTYKIYKILHNHFNLKFLCNQDLTYRIQLTYLRNLVITQSLIPTQFSWGENHLILYKNVLSSLRTKMLLKAKTKSNYV